MQGRDGRFWFGLAVGVFAVLMGLGVMLGWWLRLPIVVQVVPGYSPMVFNTALCFLASGSAILLLSRSASGERAAVLVGALLVADAVLVLFEHLFQVNSIVDWPALHTWLSQGVPYPGRTSVGTASAFLMVGAALVSAPRARNAWAIASVRALALAVGLGGLLAIAGQSLRLTFLYPSYPLAGVALHTAVGLVLLAFGLWSVWRRYEWGQRWAFAREDDRITYLGAGVLVLVASITGLVSFATLQRGTETSFNNRMLSLLKSRAELIQIVLEARATGAQYLATLPAVHTNLRAIGGGRDSASNRANIEAVIAGSMKQGFSAIAYFDADGKLVASGGRFVQTPVLAVPLALPVEAELMWDGRFVFHSRVLLRDRNGVAGAVVAETPMPVMTRVALDTAEMGETGEIALCALHHDKLECFPTRLRQQPFSIPRLGPGGELLPMARALRHETGVVTELDYRAQEVIAAHGPIGDLGLGMVVKMDAAEVFRPIRDQLQFVLLLLGLLVAAGTLLLRAQVKPLASRLVEAEREARRNEQHIRAVVEHIVEGVITIDEQGTIESFNPGAEKIFGYTAADVAGRPITMLMPDDLRAAHEGGLRRYLQTGEAHVVGKGAVGLRGRHRNGAIVDIELSISEMPIGNRRRFVGTVRDVTERRRAERALKESEDRLTLVTDNVPALVGYVDARQIFRFNNKTYEEWLGVSRAQITGRSVKEVLGEETYERFRPYLEAGLCGRRTDFEAELLHNGGARQVQGVYVPHIGEGGKVLGVYGLISDITGLKQAEARLMQLAQYDSLTGLANRSLAYDRLEQALARSRRSQNIMAVMYLDIDRFKRVNDELGHAAGDQLLKVFGARLIRSVRATDTVARLGGDEFLIVLEDVKGRDNAGRLAEKIVDAMQPDFSLDDGIVTVRVSIGLALCERGVASADMLIKRADTALYEAKEAGRNTFRIAASS